MSVISDFLGQLKQTQADLVAFAASLTQRQCVNGEIAFKQGKTYTPTVADTYQLVNDDPDKRLTSEQGKYADQLHYALGRCLTGIWQEQRKLGVKTNTGAEIYAAANSGDYSKIRGA
jgi:hypothetical protein